MWMRKSRLTKGKQDRLIEHFFEVTTAAYYYHRLHNLIYLAADNEFAFASKIEVDESYFGRHRKGKRGRGTAGKAPVIGILKRGGKVYTDHYRS